MSESQVKIIHDAGKDVLNIEKTEIDWHNDGGEKRTQTFGPVRYADGWAVEGVWGWDNVYLRPERGNFDIGMGLQLESMNIGVVSDVEPLSRLSETVHSGIIGLGFCKDPINHPSVFQFAVQNNLPVDPVLTLKLPPQSDGVMRFGYINDADIAGGRGKLSQPAKILKPKTPEDDQEWQIKSGERNRAVVDSGTRAIFLPDEDFDNIFRSLVSFGAEPISFEAQKLRSFLGLGILCGKVDALDGITIFVPLGDNNEKAVIDMKYLSTKEEVPSHPGYCYLNIMNAPHEDPSWANVLVLGRPFFNSNLVVFKLNPKNINEGWIQWARYRTEAPRTISKVTANDLQVVFN